ncbi:S-adenosyl-L-methionine-dependent methyltransferase [Neoconidiobolus thromboides FSU 785]|nr:S-adenosyl-L-methionine-dependent methyltransferase [Neoconidiobolus thromboides FSU 785]
MKSESKDLFSNHSKNYAVYRPTHQKDLIEYLVSFVNEKRLVWDVATGNGQAASLLADYFDNVIATDLSEKQISEAIKKPNIRYEVEPSEAIDSNLIAPNSVDLITVAVGIHWFPLDKFYERVNKVLKKGGIIAAWTYYIPTINEQVDEVQNKIHIEKVKQFEAEEVNYVSNGYANLPWPFRKPDNFQCGEDGVNQKFSVSKEMDFNQYCEFFKTSSAAQLYFENNGKDIIQDHYNEMLEAWGKNPSITRKVTWNIKLLLGVKE